MILFAARVGRSSIRWPVGESVSEVATPHLVLNMSVGPRIESSNIFFKRVKCHL